MICPKCKVNHRKKAGMRCVCGYSFTLDPGETNGLTDAKFLSCLNLASANATYYFTKNQLYTAYCKRMLGNSSGCLRKIFWFLIIGSIVLLVFSGGLAFPIVIIMGFAAFFVWLIGRLSITPPPREKLGDAVVKWEKEKGPIKKLIQNPGMTQPPPEFTETDIYDYGVESILIVDDDLLVDLFVLNNFHAQKHTLVISASGYPGYLLTIAEKILSESPDLPVLFLHDSKGKNMISRITHNLPFLGGVDVIDLGFFQDDIAMISAIRPTRPEKQQNRIPVDLIPYKTILALLTISLAEKVSFASILSQGGPGFGESEGYMSFG
ncbi:hypothetical protein ACFL35_13295 [Candidatus Riflebacteria bacterium]